MKDYNAIETDFSNKIALSLQPGRENEVGFSETINASDRFLHLAEAVSDMGFIGWQISAGGHREFSNVVFTSTEVRATAEDYNWIFKNCAVSKPDRVSFLKNLYEENRNVYVLAFNPEGMNHHEIPESELYGFFDDNYEVYPSGHFKELIEMLAEAGAVIRMIADSSEGKEDYGLIFLTFPDEISLRLRVMVTMAMPYVEIEDISNSPEAVKDSKRMSNNLFRVVMSNMLYALIRRQTEKTEPEELHRLEETTITAAEESGERSSDPNDGLSDSIENLNLSSRSYCSLKMSGICTIDALRTMTDEEYQRVSDLGKENIAEIKEKLASYLQQHPDYIKIPSLQAGSYYEMLDELIGLREAKQQIRKIVAFAKMRQAMSVCGDTKMSIALNMEFVGNPGTAKTTVARIAAGIFHEIGLLPSLEMIEVGRADLIGKYEGQTAGKVKDVFLKAKGKMLFIDEAYSLTECWEGAYGDEAINTIVQEMENNREDTIVVFAGYPDKMKAFFDRNPGLRSRVPFTVRFGNYSIDEMTAITELEAKKRGFQITAEAMGKVRAICDMAAGNNEAGNGRLCRNLIEGAILEYALRTYDGTKEPTNIDFLLQAEDFSIPKNIEKVHKTQQIGFAVQELL